MEDLGIGAAIPHGKAGTIDDIAEAVDKRLAKPKQRQCLIQFQNFTAGHSLVNPEKIVYSGTVYLPTMPKDVGVKMETTVLFLKTENKTSAQLVYHLVDNVNAQGGDVKKFFVIFGVPHGGGIKHDEVENWFSLQLSQATGDISLKSSESSDDQRRRGGQSLTLIKEGFRVEGTMTDAPQPNIVLKIYDHLE